MTTDDKLRELCAKATPGPWVHWVDTHLVIRLHSRAAMAEDLRICEVSVNTRNDESQYNAAFIAAANPAAVLSLLDRIEEQSKRIAELEAQAEELAMMIRVLASANKRLEPRTGTTSADRAIDLLRRHGLMGSVLRDEGDVCKDAAIKGAGGE